MTHAHVTLKLDGQTVHAGMEFDGYPSGFGEHLRRIVENHAVGGTAASSEELLDSFFAPAERNPSASTSMFRDPVVAFIRATHQEHFLAFYRYEVAESPEGLVITAFTRGLGPRGTPSLKEDWTRAFQGNVTQFLEWAKDKDV